MQVYPLIILFYDLWYPYNFKPRLQLAGSRVDEERNHGGVNFGHYVWRYIYHQLLFSLFIGILRTYKKKSLKQWKLRKLFASICCRENKKGLSWSMWLFHFSRSPKTKQFPDLKEFCYDLYQHVRNKEKKSYFCL